MLENHLQLFAKLLSAKVSKRIMADPARGHEDKAELKREVCRL
jgi:hypothetical protein